MDNQTDLRQVSALRCKPEQERYETELAHLREIINKQNMELEILRKLVNGAIDPIVQLQGATDE